MYRITQISDSFNRVFKIFELNDAAYILENSSEPLYNTDRAKIIFNNVVEGGDAVAVYSNDKGQDKEKINGMALS